MKESTPEFQVGDKCRVLEWYEFIQKFGETEDGLVKYPSSTRDSDPDDTLYFDQSFKKICGKPFTVKSVMPAPDYSYFSGKFLYRSEEDTEKIDGGIIYAIVSDFLRYDKPTFEANPESELTSFPGF